MKQLSKKKIKQRRKVGIVKAYISRAAAIRKLQIPLADFRRLCILKGIYPVEPKNKSKMTGENVTKKTYFFSRDIQYLMHEPLLERFWEFKVFMKRLTRAKGRHDLEKFNQVNENKPVYQLDTIVKERYPRFVDALRDCDDALSMCFLFAMFPKGRGRPDDLIELSKQLTQDFTKYVTDSQTLRKVFISIKGYYYQAEIMGQTVTWIVPHQFVIDKTSNVDINVMKTFTEFYIAMLGFINHKLQKTLSKMVKGDEKPDIFDEEIDKSQVQQVIALERLFKGLKFYLNREVPLESLTFVIRSFGGEVSWVKDLYSNATFDEADPTITHQIVDRSSISERRLDRVYIQPQWVYDSVNMRRLLPTEDYLMGAELPPHLSPFVSAPPATQTGTPIIKTSTEITTTTTVPDESKLANDDQQQEKSEERLKQKRKKKPKKMTVKVSKPTIVDKEELKKKEEMENRKMGIMMIPKKKKRLFDKIMKTRSQRKRKEDKLQAKRKIVSSVIQRKAVKNKGR